MEALKNPFIFASPWWKLSEELNLSEDQVLEFKQVAKGVIGVATPK